jgi:acyl-CoA thioester hydrolase
MITFKAPVKIRAIYADTDAMGIVYHGNYIRWFEIGRNELFRGMGIIYKEVEAAGFNLPVTQVYCHYLLPTQYDDEVLVETDIAYVKRASIKFTYLIRHGTRSTVLTEGYTVHACTDKEGKITRIPSMITDKFQQFYQKG